MLFKNTRFCLLAAAVFCGNIVAFGQDTWSLERAIKHAQETSLGIKQAGLTIKNAEITQDLNKKARLPNASASTNAGISSGRFFDQSLGVLVTENFKSQGLGLNFGLPLYQGGAIRTGIRQGAIDVQAARADAEQVANDLAIQVAQAFLQILLSEESLEITKKRLRQSEEQLSRTDKLIAVGTLAQNERLNLVAQIARDEGSIVGAQNQLDLSYLNLKNILQLEPDYNLKIERPTSAVPTDANPDGLTFKALFTGALGTQPQIKAGELREKSAFLNESIARSQNRPSVGIGLDMSSRWTDQAKDIVLGGTRFDTPFTVQVNGQPVEVAFPITDRTFVDVKYPTQLRRNFGLSFGVQVSQPIYQNGRASAAIQRAKIGVLQTQIQNQTVRQSLKNEVMTSLANAKAGRRTYETNLKTVAAFRQAFENTQKRYDLGAVNALDLTTAKTSLDTAESDLLISKYDYILKMKVLDFYQGKKLSLD